MLRILGSIEGFVPESASLKAVLLAFLLLLTSCLAATIVRFLVPRMAELAAFELIESAGLPGLTRAKL